MQIHDETRNPRPSPAKTPPADFGPPLPPDAPRPPWRVELRSYGGHFNTPTIMRPTKVYADGRVGELLITDSDEGMLWRYAEYLERELQRLRTAGELSVLDAATIPPAVAATLSDLSNSDPLAVAERLTEVSIQAPTPPSSTALQPASDAENPGSNPAPTKRQLAEAELLRTPGDSNVQIGERIGASHELVRLTRKSLEAAGRLQPVDAAPRRDGTPYTSGAGNVAFVSGDDEDDATG